MRKPKRNLNIADYSILRIYINLCNHYSLDLEISPGFYNLKARHLADHFLGNVNGLEEDERHEGGLVSALSPS